MSDLTDEQYGRVSRALNNYCFFGIEPATLTGIERTIFVMAKSNIDSSNKSKTSGKIGGEKGKGGAPEGNNNALKEKTIPPYSDNQYPPSNTPVDKNNTNGNGNVNENENGNGDGNAEKQPPLFIQKIQEESGKLGIILDTTLATKAAASGVDPPWLEGAFSFPVFVNEWLKDNPKYRDKTAHEMTLLFASAFSWENLRKEYPLWKQGKEHELEERERLKALETARRNHPANCECGEDLHRYSGEFWCNKCGKAYSFNEKTLKWKGSG
jgi:hypothetical protein